jgi:hypothetical protein
MMFGFAEPLEFKFFSAADSGSDIPLPLQNSL